MKETEMKPIQFSRDDSGTLVVTVKGHDPLRVTHDEACGLVAANAEPDMGLELRLMLDDHLGAQCAELAGQVFESDDPTLTTFVLGCVTALTREVVGYHSSRTGEQAPPHHGKGLPPATDAAAATATA